MPRISLQDRLFRALLRLFPREFRGDFGEQMGDDFREERADAQRHGGRSRAARVWIRTVGGVLRQAPREHFDVLRRDAAYALRLFRRRPATTVSALLTLSVGIGLTAAVFSVMYGVLWRPIPLPDSERIVTIAETSPPPEREPTGVSPANFLDWRADVRTVGPLAALSWTPVRIIQETGAEEIEGAAVSTDFFRIVRARTVLGRLLEPADYAPIEARMAARDPKAPRAATQPGVAMISYSLWQRTFGARPDIVGRKVDIGRGGIVQIVGVLEKDFAFPLAPKAECWLPDVLEAGQRRARYLRVIGRLAPGASLRDAQAEIDVIAVRSIHRFR